MRSIRSEVVSIASKERFLLEILTLSNYVNYFGKAMIYLLADK